MPIYNNNESVTIDFQRQHTLDCALPLRLRIDNVHNKRKRSNDLGWGFGHAKCRYTVSCSSKTLRNSNVKGILVCYLHLNLCGNVHNKRKQIAWLGVGEAKGR